MNTMEKYFFFQAVNARCSSCTFHWKLRLKTLFLMIRLVSQKTKTNLLLKTVIPCKILKHKRFPKTSFPISQISVNGEVHLQKSWKNQVFNFTKDRRRSVAPLVILKIFRTAISWTPAPNYFHYYVMSPSFLLVTRVFNWCFFLWQQWEMTCDRLFINISSEPSTIFHANTTTSSWIGIVWFILDFWTLGYPSVKFF